MSIADYYMRENRYPEIKETPMPSKEDKPPVRTVIDTKPKAKAEPQMASPEHLRSIGTLVTPAVKLPPMTTAQADSLETKLTVVRRDARQPILRDFLKAM